MINPDLKSGFPHIPQAGDLRTNQGKLERYEWCYESKAFGWFEIPEVTDKKLIKLDWK